MMFRTPTRLRSPRMPTASSHCRTAASSRLPTWSASSSEKVSRKRLSLMALNITTKAIWITQHFKGGFGRPSFICAAHGYSALRAGLCGGALTGRRPVGVVPISNAPEERQRRSASDASAASLKPLTAIPRFARASAGAGYRPARSRACLPSVGTVPMLVPCEGHWRSAATISERRERSLFETAPGYSALRAGLRGGAPLGAARSRACLPALGTVPM